MINKYKHFKSNINEVVKFRFALFIRTCIIPIYITLTKVTAIQRSITTHLDISESSIAYKVVEC